MFLLSACDSSDINNNISEYTKDTMINRNVVLYKNDEIKPTKEDNISDDNLDDESVNNEDLSEAKTDNHILNNYVDCVLLNECIEIAENNKKEFDGIINDIFYVDVKSNDGNLLGYFMDYSFNDYLFQNEHECIVIGNKLIDIIKNHNIDYICDSDGFMKVVYPK